MNSSELIPTLMIVTLVIAALAALILLLKFRRRHGDHPMRGERERNVGEAIDKAEARRE